MTTAHDELLDMNELYNYRGFMFYISKESLDRNQILICKSIMSEVLHKESFGDAVSKELLIKYCHAWIDTFLKPKNTIMDWFAE
jgi:hypothetical protein